MRGENVRDIFRKFAEERGNFSLDDACVGLKNYNFSRKKITWTLNGMVREGKIAKDGIGRWKVKGADLRRPSLKAERENNFRESVFRLMDALGINHQVHQVKQGPHVRVFVQ